MLSVDGVMVDLVTSVCDLGIYIDAESSTRTHVARRRAYSEPIRGFRRTSTVATGSPTRTASHVPDERSRSVVA